MSKLYSIQESTLTDIGDALRSKYGETRPATIKVPCTISKTPNATGPYTWEGTFPSGGPYYHVVRIPGAVKIEVDLYYFTTSISNGRLYIASGEYGIDNPIPKTNMYTGGQSVINKKLTYDNTEVITFDFQEAVATNALGYYAICMGYDSSDNIVEFENCDYAKQETIVPNTYSSADVADAIEGLYNKPEPVVLIGELNYSCSGALAGSYINLFGDTITTEHITRTTRMFNSNIDIEYIPFDINMSPNITHNMDYMFNGCKNLKELPKIYNANPENIQYMFYGCEKLREIPEGFSDTWKFSLQSTSYTYIGHLFYSCHSLRKIPKNFLKEIHNKSSSSYYSPYDYTFQNTYVLDEIDGLPVQNSTLTSNVFYMAFANCCRVKRLVFDLQEDGSPYTVNWRDQTIDLSSSVRLGYTYNSTWITDFNSGITADKEVKDDATYQALKDDPDWFTLKSEYSRYNRTSAVETINSLPDASAYATDGHTNTIKFYKTSGSATDGGAINTMTEEEIAVAAAKGWTVSFV